MKRLVFTIAMFLWATAALAANCTLTGQVLNVDGTPAANAIITFNPVTQQPLTTGGTAYTNQPVSTTTDSNGNLTSISLPQGLIVQISIQENGATFGGYTAIVPFMSSATFVQMNQGISTNPLNVLASSQPPTGPLSMNNQKITNLACPSTNGDALTWGCAADIGNLTLSGVFTAGSGFAVNGALTVTGFGPISAPTVTPIGVTGATTYNYYIECNDANGGSSMPSPVGSTSIGNASLTSSNYNTITWTMPAGYVNCDVLRGDTSHSIALAVTNGTWNDQQNGSGSAYVPAAWNTTWLLHFGGTGTGGYAPSVQPFGIGGGTYITPQWGPQWLKVMLSGGGGGGGAANSAGSATNGGSGGGAGGYTECWIPNPTGSYTVTSGAGGAGGVCSNSPTAAQGGGQSTFGSLGACIANGGGAGNTASASGGTGAAALATTHSIDQTAQVLLAQSGNNGSAGSTSAATAGNGGNGAGGNGGIGTTSTSGTCSLTLATAGNNGWVIVEAFP